VETKGAVWASKKEGALSEPNRNPLKRRQRKKGTIRKTGGDGPARKGKRRGFKQGR